MPGKIMPILLVCGGILFAVPITAKSETTKAQVALQQSKTIRIAGVVNEPSGVPAVGVSIRVKGTAISTATDQNGKYALNVPADGTVLFTYVGFKPFETQVDGRTTIDVTLEETQALLNEVIVVGYGTTTRKSVVGAVDQVGSKAIENRPVANLTQALQGASPSLSIQQRSQNPNDNSTNINIRGVSTMNNNSPLLVIDGLVSDISSLDKLNPADIENISILKDAGTAAIYGSRSANGVLLVSTKKGKAGDKPVVRFSVMEGNQTADVLFTPVKGYQNAILKNIALANSGSAAQFTPQQIRDLYDHQAEEQWYFDQIIQTAAQQDYNMSISGGSKSSTYLFSAGYHDQGSNFVGPDYGVRRFNLRSNITTEIGRLKLTTILAYTRNNNKASVADNAIINSSRIPAQYNYKMRADNGRYLVNDALTDQNPLGELLEGGYKTEDNDYVNLNLNAEIKLMDGLKLKGIFGADVFSDHRFTRRFEIPLYLTETSVNPQVTVNMNRNTEDFNKKAYALNSQILLDYDKTFGDHHFSGLLGATNESTTETMNEFKLTLTDPVLGVPITETVIDKTGSYVSLQHTTLKSINSFLGRFGYSYADKYYGEVSFREDGSSIFAKDNRWGFFPSGSLGWRISEENFMDFYKSNVGDLKIRGSYGILGNQNVGPYQYLTVYSTYTNSYIFNNAAVSGSGFTFGNKELKWEKTANLNIGFDATFFNNALLATFDFFDKKTSDILITPEVPTVFGGGLSNYNAGEMSNRGWELTLNYRLKTGDVNHTFGFNLGDSKNKVLKFTGKEQISTTDEISKIIRVGLPFNSYYGYKTDGVFQSYDEIEKSVLPVGMSKANLRPGDLKFVNQNDDKVIDANDRVVLGNAFPRYTFGFTYNVNYKGFDLGMLLQGVGKRDLMARGELLEPFHSNYSYVIYKHQLDFWTPENTDARWPELTAAGANSTKNNYGMGTDLNLLDGKYLRLKNIQLGYTVPQKYSGVLGIQNARIYVNAQNLLTLSADSFLDPETTEFNSNMSGGANSVRNYPFLKYYGFGVDIQF